jgi:hypothetical protein
MKSYRPTRDDHYPEETQKLSLTEAGKFDMEKFHTLDAAGKIVRRPTTRWSLVCRERTGRGISRQDCIAGIRKATRDV